MMMASNYGATFLLFASLVDVKGLIVAYSYYFKAYTEHIHMGPDEAIIIRPHEVYQSLPHARW